MIQLNAIIMAAGRSQRFGSNKLLLPLQGKPVIQHLLDHLPFQLFQRVVLVYSHPQVEAIAARYPLALCRNDQPEAGQGTTIRLGVEASGTATGTLFLVADQPLLKGSTIVALAEQFRRHPTRIIMPVCAEKPGNPVFFPASCLEELKNLRGDVGGKVVIRNHPELIMTVPCSDPEEFIDIDTAETYSELKQLCGDRN